MKMLSVSVFLLLVGPAVVYAQAYDVLDLGTLGGNQSEAYSLNNAGDVVGDSTLPNGAWRAYVYRNGRMIDLGASQGMPMAQSHGHVINDVGNIVGISTFIILGRTQICGAAWVPPEQGPFGPYMCGGIDGGTGNATFFGLSNAGHITGCSQDRRGMSRAFVMYRGISILPTFGGEAAGYAVNNSGQVVGYAEVGGGKYSGFYHQPPDQTMLMGDLGGGYSVLYDLNNNGVAVGMSYTYDGELHAVSYTPADGIQEIGPVDGSIAAAVNNRGDVVGFVAAQRYEDYRAALFTGGRTVDLNSLIDRGAGWVLLLAYDINDSGVIVGTGLHNGQWRAYKLTPRR